MQSYSKHALTKEKDLQGKKEDGVDTERSAFYGRLWFFLFSSHTPDTAFSVLSFLKQQLLLRWLPDIIF